MSPAQHASPLAAFAVAVCVLACSAPLAHAQDDADDNAPVNLILVDVSKRGSKRVYRTLSNVMSKSDDIRLVDQGKFWVAADKLTLNENVFRSSDERRRRSVTIRELMREMELESILLMAVSSKGNKVQMVFMGPEGDEIAFVARKIKRGRMPTKTAVSMLKEGFTPLIPRIQGWRRERDEARQKQLQAQAQAKDEAARAKAQARDKVETAPEPGLVSRGIDIGAGALFGRRELAVETPGDYSLRHRVPFIGVALGARGILATFSQDSAGFGLSANLDYAPFTSILAGDDGAQQEVGSTFLRVGGNLLVVKAFSDTLGIEGYAGAELLTIAVAPNTFYTGNRYVNLRLGAAMRVAFASVIRLRLGGSILPVVSADTSGGAYGPAAFAMGFEGLVGLGFQLTEALSLSTGYALSYLPPDYPEPTRIDDPASTTDIMHIGSATVGLSF